MEEEDKKAERDLEILKKYHKKETKSVKKIFITLFLLFALVYIVKLLMGLVLVKNKILAIISVIVVIIILFLARTIYSDHNLKKVIGACILAQTQTSNLEEAKQICVDKFK